MARKWGSEKRPRDAGGEPLLIRAEACNLLKLSKRRLRELEQRGDLQGIEQGGVRYFTRQSVLQLAKTRDGGLSSAVFQAFEAGQLPVQVVIELNADPDYVHSLWESYQRMLGCWVVAGPGSLRAWQGVYKLGELTPHKLLRALELVCADPALRAELTGE